jgi:HemY protein
MIRILFFLIVVFALGLGFAWLADRPGLMVMTFDGYRYEISLMVGAVAVTALVAAIMLSWWLVKAIWNSPYTVARYFRVRRRDRGYQALSTGMIAAGAGDAALARKMKKQAAKMIRSDQEPLINLLDAQSSLLEGDHEAARAKFESMLDDPEMRLLGLRGLYLEAERLGDKAAARHYAGRAAAVAPQLAWASDATLEEKTEDSDWDGALALIDAQKSTHQIEKDTANRRRSVLLTAKAMALFDTDPAAARTAAVEANRLRPDFVPAALIAAKALFRQNEVRKGAKILETVWKKEPHPEVADLYVHARAGDAVLDRLNRAKKLQSFKQNHPESSLAVARAAIDAGEYSLARSEAEAAVRMQPREAAYLVLADIEEAETGDQGRMRQWLSRAVRAPRDPAWVADGYVSDRWEPASPVTGKLDAFEWRVPVERLGHLIDQEDPLPQAELTAIEAPATVEDIEDIEPAPVEEIAAEPVAPVKEPKQKTEAPQTFVPPPRNDVLPSRAAFYDAEQSVKAPPLPDDPGVDEDENGTDYENRRFRLF